MGLVCPSIVFILVLISNSEFSLSFNCNFDFRIETLTDGCCFWSGSKCLTCYLVMYGSTYGVDSLTTAGSLLG